MNNWSTKIRTEKTSRCFLFLLIFVMSVFFHSVKAQQIDSSQKTFPFWAPSGDRFAFVSWDESEDNIWIADINGDNARNLTFNVNGNKFSPKWSPDERYIAFNVAYRDSDQEESSSDLYIINLETDEITNLTDRISAVVVSEDFAWSPNAEYLAFGIGYDSYQRDVWVANIADNTLTNVSKAGDKFNSYPIWLSDDSLLYTRTDQHSSEDQLFITRIDENDEELIINDDILVFALSPDKEYIAYIPLPTPQALTTMTIFSIKLNQVVKEVDGNFGYSLLKWSPNGDEILFEVPSNAGTDIMTFNWDTEVFTNLTGCSCESHRNPVWSPNGQYILYQSDKSGTSGIWLMEKDGANPTEITFHQ